MQPSSIFFYFQSLSALPSPRKEQERLSESLRTTPPRSKILIQQKNSKGRAQQVWGLQSSPVCRTKVRTPGGHLGQGTSWGREEEKNDPELHKFAFMWKQDRIRKWNSHKRCIKNKTKTKNQTPLTSIGSWDISVFSTEICILSFQLFLKLC